MCWHSSRRRRQGLLQRQQRRRRAFLRNERLVTLSGRMWLNTVCLGLVMRVPLSGRLCGLARQHPRTCKINGYTLLGIRKISMSRDPSCNNSSLPESCFWQWSSFQKGWSATCLRCVFRSVLGALGHVLVVEVHEDREAIVAFAQDIGVFGHTTGIVAKSVRTSWRSAAIVSSFASSWQHRRSRRRQTSCRSSNAGKHSGCRSMRP